MSLKKIRQAITILAAQVESNTPLTDVTLLSDGSTIYAAHSADEVVDIFARGQGVFGIAVGPVESELEAELHQLDRDEAVGEPAAAGDDHSAESRRAAEGRAT
jgi:hypothetical protein